jgi:hypothetical protein
VTITLMVGDWRRPCVVGTIFKVIFYSVYFCIHGIVPQLVGCQSWAFETNGRALGVIWGFRQKCGVNVALFCGTPCVNFTNPRLTYQCSRIKQAKCGGDCVCPQFAKKTSSYCGGEAPVSLAKTLFYAAGQGVRVILRSRLAFDGFQARALPGASLADPQGDLREPRPQGPVDGSQPWSVGTPAQNQQLVSQRQILQEQVAAGFHSGQDQTQQKCPRIKPVLTPEEFQSSVSVPSENTS